MNKNFQEIKQIAPLFLVIFIDSMGLSLLFPVLSTIIMDPNAGFISAHIRLELREFIYGFIIAIFMICWFFGAAILGDLSDSIGRKKSLIICLLGTFIGYLLSAFGIPLRSISLLLIGRVVAGFTAGSQVIAQASIVDVSREETKARNIAYMIFAASVGFVAGPIIGGILSNPKIISWFNYATPLYFAALISLLNAVLLYLLFVETFTGYKKIRLSLYHAIEIFLQAFKHPAVRKLSIVLMVLIFGWASFITFISPFLFQKYHFDIQKIALYMAALGTGFGISSGFLVGFLAKRFDLRNTIIVCLFISVIAVLTLLLTHALIFVWTSAFVTGLAMAIAYADMIALFSNQVSREQQGWVMGVTGSIMALCFGVTTLIAAVVVSFGPQLVLWLAVFGLAGSAILLILLKKNSN